MADDDDLSFISDEDVESISSKVSKLTFVNETAATGTSFKTHHTRFKSILYQQEKSDNAEAKSKRKKKTVYGAKALLLPFIIDTWSSKKARMCCSVQVMCLGTKFPKKYHTFRVSTDRRFLILTIVLSENALDEQKAFYKTIIQLPEIQREMIGFRTKFAARKMSVGNLTGRDNKKTVEIKQRIPLPFECEHKLATKDDDPFFNGVNFVPYKDSGEVWAHVELVQHIRDGYVGRDSFLESIGEDEDTLLGEGVDVEMSDGDEFSLVSGRESVREYASVATSVLQDEQESAAAKADTRDVFQTVVAEARENEQALAVTPQKPNHSVPAAKYPAVLTDAQIRMLRSNRSVCSGITAAGNRIVSHTPATTPTKSSAASYDGRLQRDNVKRIARYQGLMTLKQNLDRKPNVCFIIFFRDAKFYQKFSPLRCFEKLENSKLSRKITIIKCNKYLKLDTFIQFT